jgi:hypothetical protein
VSPSSTSRNEPDRESISKWPCDSSPKGIHIISFARTKSVAAYYKNGHKWLYFVAFS